MRRSDPEQAIKNYQIWLHDTVHNGAACSHGSEKDNVCPHWAIHCASLQGGNPIGGHKAITKSFDANSWWRFDFLAGPIGITEKGTRVSTSTRVKSHFNEVAHAVSVMINSTTPKLQCFTFAHEGIGNSILIYRTI